MTALIRLSLIFFTGFFSCSIADSPRKEQGNQITDTVKQMQYPKESPVADTIKRFIVDDYPVTDEMLDDMTSNNSSYSRQSGEVHSFDKAWFTNNVLNQTLVFEMYTDKHRLVTFHFLNNNIPDALIDRIELHKSNGELASLDQKKKNFKGFIKTAIPIKSRYLTTNKGFKLGDPKNKALTLYGKPDSSSKIDSLEILEWNFVGDILYDGKSDLKGKPLAKDNYGHQVTFFFNKNRLIAIILHNDIP